MTGGEKIKCVHIENSQYVITFPNFTKFSGHWKIPKYFPCKLGLNIVIKIHGSFDKYCVYVTCDIKLWICCSSLQMNFWLLPRKDCYWLSIYLQQPIKREKKKSVYRNSYIHISFQKWFWIISIYKFCVIDGRIEYKILLEIGLVYSK